LASDGAHDTRVARGNPWDSYVAQQHVSMSIAIDILHGSRATANEERRRRHDLSEYGSCFSRENERPIRTGRPCRNVVDHSAFIDVVEVPDPSTDGNAIGGTGIDPN